MNILPDNIERRYDGQKLTQIPATPQVAIARARMRTATVTPCIIFIYCPTIRLFVRPSQFLIEWGKKDLSVFELYSIFARTKNLRPVCLMTGRKGKRGKRGFPYFLFTRGYRFFPAIWSGFSTG